MNPATKHHKIPSGFLKKNVIILFLGLVFVPYFLWGAMDYVITFRRKNDAFSYFHNKDYSTAYREIMPFAMSGDSEARFIIGSMTAFGVGTSRDKMLATQWFSCEGISGCIKGSNEFRAGKGCFSGEWGDLSYEDCILWLKFSSELGYKPASELLEEYQKKKAAEFSSDKKPPK
jgi:TPR repeat protein